MYGQLYPGFESLPLREESKTPHGEAGLAEAFRRRRTNLFYVSCVHFKLISYFSFNNKAKAVSLVKEYYNARLRSLRNFGEA